MSGKPEDGTEFENRAREVLEESTARLDGRTLSRLTQARHTALGQLQRPVRQRWFAWVPAGAAAAAAVRCVVMWSGQGTEPASEPAMALSPVEDLELLAEAPEFVDEGEDLEFYEWAATQMGTSEVES